MALCILGRDRADVIERVRRLLELRADPRDPAELVDGDHPTWLVGTVEQVAERLGSYAEAGASRVFLQHLDHADLDAVRLIGEELVPAVADL